MGDQIKDKIQRQVCSSGTTSRLLWVTICMLAACGTCQKAVSYRVQRVELNCFPGPPSLISDKPFLKVYQRRWTLDSVWVYLYKWGWGVYVWLLLLHTASENASWTKEINVQGCAANTMKQQGRQGERQRGVKIRMNGITNSTEKWLPVGGNAPCWLNLNVVMFTGGVNIP